MKTKILTLAGVRPNYTRLAALIHLFDKGGGGIFDHVLVHTGQHFDDVLYKDFFRCLGLRMPDIDLELGRILQKREIQDQKLQIPILLELFLECVKHVRPDLIVMSGDTNTVLASVMASRCDIPFIHIEAGLRSYDWRMPEEKNRIIIDHLADALYCYLPEHRDILISEGIDTRRISVVGNVIVDTLRIYTPQIEQSAILARLGVEEKNFFLCTLHREENTSSKEIFERKICAIRDASRKYHMPVIFPLMPCTTHALENFALRSILDDPAFIITEPLDFFDFVKLEKTARLIISDSGTVQEEALILGTPMVIARRSTERPEVLSAHSAILEGMESLNSLDNAIKKGMELPLDWDREILNPQGGSPSERIVKDIQEKIQNDFFHVSREPVFVAYNNKRAQKAYGFPF